MTKKSLKVRINDLENFNPDRPFKAIFQDWDDPNLWHINGQQSDSPLTRAAVEKQFPNHDILEVVYIKDWKAVTT